MCSCSSRIRKQKNAKKNKLDIIVLTRTAPHCSVVVQRSVSTYVRYVVLAYLCADIERTSRSRADRELYIVMTVCGSTFKTITAYAVVLLLLCAGGRWREKRESQFGQVQRDEGKGCFCVSIHLSVYERAHLSGGRVEYRGIRLWWVLVRDVCVV